MSKLANMMLVHGAWADGSCWSKVILLLQAQGLKVTAAQIPLTSLSDDIAVTRRLLSMQTQPTVLVGHSAFGLDQGESLDSLSRQGPPAPGAAAIAADAHGYLWIDREKFHKSFAADVTNDEASIMAAVQRPLSVASFTEAEGTPAWKSIPSWYLVCTEDQMIPPPAQQFFAKRMNATVRSVSSSHAPFMSKPREVADIIALAAGSMPA